MNQLMMKEPSDYEMSLLYVVLNGYSLNQNYYNCTDPTAIQEVRIKQNLLGWYFMVTGTVFILRYVPCIFAILMSDLRKMSCFKIMLCLSVFDILSLVVNSIATGFYAFKGVSFCDSPNTIFLFGCIALGSWMGGCFGCIVLAINRCCDLNPSLKLKWIFKGKRIYFVIFLIMIYALYLFLLIKPPLFSSEYVTWFFNPRINFNPLWYFNIQHTTNNLIVSICTTLLYVYLCFVLFLRSQIVSSESISKTQRQVFLQSVLICTFNAIAAYIYVYMQYFSSPPLVILIGQIAWQWSNDI